MSVRSIGCLLLFLYWLVLLARIFLSWFPPPRTPLGRRAVDVIYDLTEPVMKPLRNLIPPIRMGMMALDLSPIIVFIAISIIQRSIGCGGVI